MEEGTSLIYMVSGSQYKATFSIALLKQVSGMMKMHMSV
ncbi:hypothetical protein HAP32_02513 [Serratia fonticola]|nr:hypothetical protein HAP32_02513 [Serratia fonticola]